MTTNDYNTIDVAVDGAVGRVTLNRPDKLNPLSTATLLPSWPTRSRHSTEPMA